MRDYLCIGIIVFLSPPGEMYNDMDPANDVSALDSPLACNKPSLYRIAKQALVETDTIERWRKVGDRAF